MGPRRIFFFNRFFWPDQSATAQILTDLCRELDGVGYPITVVTSRLDYSDPGIQYPAREQLGGVTIIRLWSTRFGRGTIFGRLLDYLSIYVSFFFYILRRLGPEDTAILKTDPPLLSILGAAAKSLRQFRVVAWCQDLFPEVAMAEIAPSAVMKGVFGLLRGLRDWSLQCSDRAVVLGRDMRNYLLGRSIEAGRLVTIANWSIQDDGEDRLEEDLRLEWGIGRDTVVIGYSGNLGRAHDWQTVLEAARLLRNRADILFLCTGGGFGFQKLREAVESEGLERQFQFRPYQPLERLGASLRVPDVHWLTLKDRLTKFIFPSKFYGILQAGRPLIFIGDTRSELAEIIATARIGASVGTGESGRLAELIGDLASDRPYFEEAGRRARRLWEAEYQKSLEVAKWDCLLEDIQAGKD